MAYMRGKNYIWDDVSGLHIWARDGYDGWDNAGWACDEDDIRHEGYENASGVSISMDVMDEYVVKRLAQMIYEGKVDAAIERAITQNTNVGGMTLKRSAAIIKEALSQIKLNDAEPYVWKKDEKGNTIFD